jgi:homeobox protein cut-like
MSAQSSLNQRSLASQMAHHHQQQQQQQHHHHQQQQQQQQQLHQSPVLVKIDKNSSSSVSKSLSNTPLGGHNNNATSNGLTPSPMDDSSTPTPGLTGSGIPTLAAYSLPAHSVYELAALTQDLDTQGMTTKIKEVLLANNIGQKIFGEAVLGLSQGSVSELLSKPKPWHMLSIKGREPFIRMQLWLSDPRNIEHIQRLKTERREAGKRRRDLGFPMGATDAAGPNSNASATPTRSWAVTIRATTARWAAVRLRTAATPTTTTTTKPRR